MLELEWRGEGCLKSGDSGYKVEKRIEGREGGKRRAGRVKGIVGREINKKQRISRGNRDE